jgi:aromatic-L-amino-acid/L-tryptophan decarboxylase
MRSTSTTLVIMQGEAAAMTGSALDPPPEEVRAMAGAATEWLVDYLASVGQRPVAPATSAAELRDALTGHTPEPVPAQGRDFAALLEAFRDVVVPGTRHHGHPRFFGYVSAPGTAIAAVADLLASGLNANLPAWRSAPAPVELERLTIDWIRQLLGCAPGTAGLFLSGGSLANLSAIAAARHRHCGPDVTARGMAAHGAPLRLYASTGAHHSIHKAAALLGIGRDAVREVPVDSRLRMDVAELDRAIGEDRAAGADPFCVVANAGTVVTGAVDPLAEIAAVARRHGLWLHVDACYGGFARLAPSTAGLFDGLAEADSIALDPHKWLYLPADCGCLLYRDPAAARGAFALDAHYTRVLQTEPAEAFAYWDYGPELSRRFRALKVWMTLAFAGTRAIGEAIESNLDCARYVASLVDSSEDLELLAPVELSIFCFRYRPPGTPDGPELDWLNERIMLALQEDGSSYLSNATIRGRFALRGCVLNYRTTRADMETLLHDVRRAAARVTG